MKEGSVSMYGFEQLLLVLHFCVVLKMHAGLFCIVGLVHHSVFVPIEAASSFSTCFFVSFVPLDRVIWNEFNRNNKLIGWFCLQHDIKPSNFSTIPKITFCLFRLRCTLFCKKLLSHPKQLAITWFVVLYIERDHVNVNLFKQVFEEHVLKVQQCLQNFTKKVCQSGICRTEHGPFDIKWVCCTLKTCGRLSAKM